VLLRSDREFLQTILEETYKHIDASVEANKHNLEELSPQEMAFAVINYAFWLRREGYLMEEVIRLVCQAIDAAALDPKKIPSVPERIENDLPILDLSGFHLHHPPDQFFMVLDQPQNKKEEAALQKLLGIQKLIKDHDRSTKRLRSKLDGEAAAETVRRFGILHPVGQTADGNMIVVALQLVVGPRMRHRKWFGYVCSPERYEDLYRRFEDKMHELGINFEIRLSGLTDAEWHELFPEP